MISEKPSAAKRIAEALDDQDAFREVKSGKASYYECNCQGDSLAVAYALGHLYELRQTEKGWTYPRLDTEWAPKYEVEKSAGGTKPVIELIRRLSVNADRFIVATDYDIEGSLIGYLIVKHICGIDPSRAQRMVFSSLTKPELQKAYGTLMPTLDFPMVESGCVRHEVDWLYGINLTRALTLALKNTTGLFRIVSTGRVQGPTLAFVAERDQQINLFVPIPFWTLSTTGVVDGQQVSLEYSERRIETKAQAGTLVKDLLGRTARVISISSRISSQRPPPPFNLSDLQSEAYRHFELRPSRTLQIAQGLYLDALITYPRTNSQKVPPSLDVRQTLEGIGKMSKYAPFVRRLLQHKSLVPVQGEKEDQAHPAILPTGNRPTEKLAGNEERVYDLVVRRFLALFEEPVVKRIVRANIRCDEHLFYLRGLRVLEAGWTSLYSPYVITNEKAIPPISEGNIIDLTSVRADEKYTPPPPRFNPSSLLKLLEKENLGTKATRAGIIDSINSRGYTLGSRFELSALGYAAFEALQTHVPDMLSADMTRRLELKMEEIQQGIGQRKTALLDAKNELVKLLENFRLQEQSIGQALAKGLRRYWREEQEIGPCPSCADGVLAVIYSPKTGKRFVGCSNHQKGTCNMTFPLPQKGKLIPLGRTCPHCGHHVIKILSGKRGWETCLNWTECPGRQQDIELLEKRRTRRRTKDQPNGGEDV